MAEGRVRLVVVLEASGSVRLYWEDWGEGMGEIDFSENVVVDEAGDGLPPQPKKDPSFEAPGDFGSAFWMVVLDSFESFE
jgi:hypothetical protein